MFLRKETLPIHFVIGLLNNIESLSWFYSRLQWQFENYSDKSLLAHQLECSPTWEPEPSSTSEYSCIYSVPRYWLHAEKALKSHKCVLKSYSLLGCPAAERTQACKPGRLGFKSNWLCDCANLVTSLCLSSNELSGNNGFGTYLCLSLFWWEASQEGFEAGGRQEWFVCSVTCLILTEGTAVNMNSFLPPV